VDICHNTAITAQSEKKYRTFCRTSGKKYRTFDRTSEAYFATRVMALLYLGSILKVAMLAFIGQGCYSLRSQ